MNLDELSEMTAATQQKRLRRDRLLTPEQRLQRFEQLQKLAFQTLESNPQALLAFHKRNHHQRRLASVIELERRLISTACSK